MNKILIANRGEIAVRIIRACKEMNIKTVAVYSEADKDALHTRLADEAICIGPAPSIRSYLNIKSIIEAACVTGSDSIHPGYGFLSENPQFAKICEESNIKFIGPKSNVIELLANKSNAKKLMKEAGVPVIPGSNGSIKDFSELKKLAEEIGYPIMLKAAAGGGGKGIRVVQSSAELEKSYNIVKQEAKVSFNDDEIYVEKFIQNPRHVEIQILADEHGNIIHLGERDCSIQRKNQKIIEETPSTVVDEKLRKKMGEAAIKAAKITGYTSCGTVEFLVDKDKNFYFMEMNTRIQVEHPITEMRTGIDIVKEQIKIAAGEELKYKQKDIEFRGHSIECRINAENPDKDFMPCPGTITGLNFPGGNGIRIDSSIYDGYTIPFSYDSMIAKIIVHGNTRNEAISKMKRALEELIIEGVDNNADFIYKIIKNPDFIRGDFDTSFIVHLGRVSMHEKIKKLNEVMQVVGHKGDIKFCIETRPKCTKCKKEVKSVIVDKIKKREPSAKNKASNVDIPIGKWIKCDKCKEIVYKEAMRENLNICPNCGTYFRMHIDKRIELITDKDTYQKLDIDIDTTNPLEMEDYPKKIKTLREKTGLKEAVACGTAKINGEDAVICIMDSGFLMGSMGVVVGEKITYAIEKAVELKLPLVIFSASGGARMQEGIISLMQMAKTTAALTKLDEAGLLYISVFTDPTYGGVTASFASLGDIVLAEPGAMIGFAGQRVIEQTIGESLPEGFQTAEFLLEHGFIDKIVERKELKDIISTLIKYHKF